MIYLTAKKLSLRIFADDTNMCFSSLRSKRFRGVWQQRKTRNGILVFCLREKWGESQK